MTAEESKLIDESSVKNLQALRDIDPRIGQPLSQKVVNLLRSGRMKDSGNRLIRGPRTEKVYRAIPPTFSPKYAMGDGMQTVVAAAPIQGWIERDNVGSDVSRSYDVQRVDGDTFDMADEGPAFRARELVLSGEAKLIRGYPVSHEPTADGFCRYYAWYQIGTWPERDHYGIARSINFELVEWFGVAGLGGFPKTPTQLYLNPANFHPGVVAYEGEPTELYFGGQLSSRRWFRIPRQRNRNMETPEAAKERLRKQWIDEQMAAKT